MEKLSLDTVFDCNFLNVDFEGTTKDPETWSPMPVRYSVENQFTGDHFMFLCNFIDDFIVRFISFRFD